MMTDEEMAIMQRGNTDELRALVLCKVALLEEKDKTITWQRDVIERGIKWQTVRRGSAARLVNEIYHDNNFKTYAKNKGKKKPSRPLVIDYIRSGEIPTTSKFYERARIIRESVLVDLAKSANHHDVDAAWNSILTEAKKLDPDKKPIERKRNNSKSRIVPNIGDSSSRYKGW